jgi:transcriptional regulator with XRE-family HTH domain
MNFLDKLDNLMKINNLNKKKLSEVSEIPYTTIVNWYKRGYDNMSISTFKKLCDFFGVTMDYFGRDEIRDIEYFNLNKKDIKLTKDEEFLVSCYRSSDSLDKELALRALKADEKGDAEKMA